MKRYLLPLGLLALSITSTGCHMGTWGWFSDASMPVSITPTKWGSGEPVFERASRDGRTDDNRSRDVYGIRDGEPWDLR